MKDKEHHLILKLGGAEYIAIQIRDKLFNGSWEKMLEWIRKEGSNEQKKDILMIKKLINYEKRYDINLNDKNWTEI